MSIKLMSQIWERDLDAAEQRVLLVLADHARDDGTHCFPSEPFVAWKLGINERTVRRVIKALEDRGVISVKRRRGFSNQYTLHIDRVPLKAPFGDPGHFVQQGADMTENVQQNVENVRGTPDTHALLTTNKPSDLTTKETYVSQESAQSNNGWDVPDEAWAATHNSDTKAKEEKRRMQAEALGIVFEFYNVTGGKQPPNIGANIKAAKHFLTLGGNVSMVRDYIEFFRGQQWFTGAITMNTLASDKLFDRYWNERHQPRQKRKTLPTL